MTAAQVLVDESNPSTELSLLTDRGSVSAAKFCEDCGQYHECAMNPHAAPCMGHLSRRDEKGNLVPCKMPARQNGSVCHKHGLGTKKKPGGRPITTGRYSRTLPTGILHRLEEGLRDPKLLSHRRDIGLTDQAIEGLLAELDISGDGELALTRTQRQDLQSLIGTRRNLVDAEWKAMKDAQQVFTVQQLNQVLAKLIDMLKRNLQSLTCPQCRAAIGDQFLRPILGEIRVLVAGGEQQKEE